MSDESTKTQLIRSKKFIDTYFAGDVLDIGGGDDPVVKHAEVFDLIHGDAQHILDYKKKESYDCVNSSHCLEHMKDVPSALSQWWGLVKPGGYLVTVVPHEDLYEQGIWPPVFNKDHKATFRLDSAKSWSPVSYDIKNLMESLPKSKIITVEIQDHNYDYKLQGRLFGGIGRKIHKYRFRKKNIKQYFGKIMYEQLYKKYWESENGQYIDQTIGNALAQIQVVIQKEY